ncbi:MAG: hypothetical protein WCJ64_12060 [Rhodospirillaceae bacterium]
MAPPLKFQQGCVQGAVKDGDNMNLQIGNITSFRDLSEGTIIQLKDGRIFNIDEVHEGGVIVADRVVTTDRLYQVFIGHSELGVGDIIGAQIISRS